MEQHRYIAQVACAAAGLRDRLETGLRRAHESEEDRGNIQVVAPDGEAVSLHPFHLFQSIVFREKNMMSTVPQEYLNVIGLPL